MTSVLLHTCCGPCAVSVVSSLRGEGLEVAAFWYNPNVHPFREHQQRLEAMQVYAREAKLPLVVAEGYEMVAYFRAVVGHEGDRCPHCYRMRLARTAREARERGLDAFTTTLLSSPYQQHELLRQMGTDLGAQLGVEFLYRDFRPGFREGHRLSREMGLYHQGYCGCVYSEWERYGKVKL